MSVFGRLLSLFFILLLVPCESSVRQAKNRKTQAVNDVINLIASNRTKSSSQIPGFEQANSRWRERNGEFQMQYLAATQTKINLQNQLRQLELELQKL